MDFASCKEKYALFQSRETRFLLYARLYFQTNKVLFMRRWKMAAYSYNGNEK